MPSIHLSPAKLIATICGVFLLVPSRVQNSIESLARNQPLVQAVTISDSKLVEINAVSVGEAHACAVTMSGAVVCWGYNGQGELGDGNAGFFYQKTPVYALVSDRAKAVAAGGYNTCALTEANGVKCWGMYTGDGTSAPHATPVDVVGLESEVTAVSAGEDHTCALTAMGGVKCWGSNEEGQLGDGTRTARWSPVDVVGLTSGVTSISAGYRRTCAVTETGGIQCWGDGSSTPSAVLGIGEKVQTVSVGDRFACLLTTSGGTKCWGSNDFGQLGNGTTTSSSTPVDVVGLAGGVTAVSAGSSQTCALMDGGIVRCWGDNSRGMLGDGTNEHHPTPVNVVAIGDGAKAVSAGAGRSCAVTVAGGVKCWGDNRYGQLGDGTTSDFHTPADVLGLGSNVAEISAGSSHTCAIVTGGAINCWGDNTYGQVGDGTNLSRPTPVDVVQLGTNTIVVTTGDNHTCVLTTSGGVKCWGHNESGQLGDGTRQNRSTPVDVVGLNTGVQSVSAGGSHTCALTVTGAVKCWGRYDYGKVWGELYPPYEAVNLTPVDVSGLSSGVKTIAAGHGHTCALTTEGAVKCWGSNIAGQLGDGTVIQSFTPVDVVGLSSGVEAINARGFRSYAITAVGSVQYWGVIYVGPNSTIVRQLIPTGLPGFERDVQGLYPGYSHECALMIGHRLKCRGENNFGQLGDGTVIDARATPVDVVGLGAEVQSAAAGGSHTCALTTARSVKCWGDNYVGQLGITSWEPKDVAAVRPPSNYLPWVAQ